MEPEAYFLAAADLAPFLEQACRGSIYATVDEQGRAAYEQIPPGAAERVVLTLPPPIESLKGFLFPLQERVAVYPSAGAVAGTDEHASAGAPQTVVGARACDIYALEILDKVFLGGETKDPFYQQRRRNTVIITTDCVEPREACFCNLVGGKAHPEHGFDLNLAPIEGGYLVSPGSDTGSEIAAQAQALLKPATAEQLAQRDRRREQVLQLLKTRNKQYEPAAPAIDNKRPGPSAPSMPPPVEWSKVTACCVECGACSYICPTCHCFLLFDQPRPDGRRNERFKTWDSCLLSNFAKMAGVGGIKPTPRPELRHRFENRVRHKFEWMPANLQVLGCVGCGRCIEACLGGSDMREIFKEIAP